MGNLSYINFSSFFFFNNIIIINQIRWVSLLSHWYSRKADILNRGYSGYNSRYLKLLSFYISFPKLCLPFDINRWGLKIFHDVINYQPNMIIIFFGANDAVYENVLQYVPTFEFKENLEKMILITKKSLPQTDIVLITPPPIEEEMLQVNKFIILIINSYSLFLFSV